MCGSVSVSSAAARERAKKEDGMNRYARRPSLRRLTRRPRSIASSCSRVTRRPPSSWSARPTRRRVSPRVGVYTPTPRLDSRSPKKTIDTNKSARESTDTASRLVPRRRVHRSLPIPSPRTWRARFARRRRAARARVAPLRALFSSVSPRTATPASPTHRLERQTFCARLWRASRASPGRQRRRSRWMRTGGDFATNRHRRATRAGRRFGRRLETARARIRAS